MDNLTAMQNLRVAVQLKYTHAVMQPETAVIYAYKIALKDMLDMIDASLEPEAEQMVDFFERGCFHPKPIINTQIEGQKLYNQIYGDGK